MNPVFGCPVFGWLLYYNTTSDAFIKRLKIWKKIVKLNEWFAGPITEMRAPKFSSGIISFIFIRHWRFLVLSFWHSGPARIRVREIFSWFNWFSQRASYWCSALSCRKRCLMDKANPIKCVIPLEPNFEVSAFEISTIRWSDIFTSTKVWTSLISSIVRVSVVQVLWNVRA